MPAEPLAEASVRVRPDSRDFKRELIDEVEGAGAEAGEQEGRGFGGRFSATAKKEIAKSLAELPDLKIDADSSPAEQRLAFLKTELIALSDKEIGVDINSDKALSEISRIKAELEALGNSSGTSIQLQIDTAAAAGGLERLLESLTPQVEDAGKQIGSRLAAPVGPAMIGVLGAAALAAAPVVGSTVGAAIIGGVGLGGIVGGVAAAAQDSRVQEAGSRLGERLLSNFARAGEPFIEPVLDSIKQLESVGDQFFTKIAKDAEPLADTLDDLTDGAAEFANRLDLSKAFETAVPLIEVAADELPQVADALTEMFSSIAEEGDGAAAGLRQTFDLIETGIVVTGDIIATLSALEETVVDTTAAVGELGDEFMDGPLKYVLPGLIPLAEQIGAVGDKADEFTDRSIRARGASVDLADGLHGVKTEAEKAAAELSDVNDEIHKMFGIQMNADEALARYKQGIRDLREELTEGKKTLSDNTQEGLDNAAAVRDQLRAIEDLRVAQAEQTGDVKAADKAYEQHIKALEKTLLNLGYNKDEVHRLIDAYKHIPKLVETEHRITTTWYGGASLSTTAAERRMQGRAGGGDVEALTPYRVGEKGEEIFVPDVPGSIVPHHDLGSWEATMAKGSEPTYQAGPSAEQIGAAVAQALAPLLSLGFDARFEVGADQLALLVRRGERDLEYAT